MPFPLHRALLTALLAAPLAAASAPEATSCLVTGEPTARVLTPQGERSPVFMAADCAALRLVQGRALASWVSRQGRPQLVPITAQGPTQVPTAGAEERPVRLSWTELTTKRERQQPGFMREVGAERPAAVWLPSHGLVLAVAGPQGAMLRMWRVSAGTEQPLPEQAVPAGASVRLERAMLAGAESVRIDLLQGERTDRWRLRLLTGDEATRLEQGLAEIDAALDVPAQRLLMQAMLYEQMRLPLNAQKALEAARDASGPYRAD